LCSVTACHDTGVEVMSDAEAEFGATSLSASFDDFFSASLIDSGALRITVGAGTSARRELLVELFQPCPRKATSKPPEKSAAASAGPRFVGILLRPRQSCFCSRVLTLPM